MNDQEVSVHVPTALRAYTDARPIVLLTGTTVGEAMADLVERFPTLRKHLYDDEGGLRSFVHLYLNGNDIESLDGIQTSLSPGNRLAIFPAIAGG